MESFKLSALVGSYKYKARLTRNKHDNLFCSIINDGE
jgi:hypothetical protein